MLMTMEDVPEEHKAHPRNMKRKDLIKQITSIGCVLVRHGQRHDLYPVRNNAPLLPPGQRPSLRGRSPSWAEPGPAAAAGLHFRMIPEGFNAPLGFESRYSGTRISNGVY